MSTTLHKLHVDDRFEHVTLIPPNTHGYLHVAAEVDRRPSWMPSSRAKSNLLARLKELCARLEGREDVCRALVFDAIFTPPGRGAILTDHPDVHVARFDVVVLIEARAFDDLDAISRDPALGEVMELLEAQSTHTHTVRARNTRRIGPVDHDDQGVYLFNYFWATDLERNLAIWEYTAGWFERETRLDNSTLLQPADPSESAYTLINHCRWSSLRDVLPSLIFKPSFRTFVLGNFEANQTAAMPILYTLA